MTTAFRIKESAAVGTSGPLCTTLPCTQSNGSLVLVLKNWDQRSNKESEQRWWSWIHLLI